jgi:hypothetical protein
MEDVMARALAQIPATNVDRRSGTRRELSLTVTLRREGADEIVPAAIANLSETGFLAALAEGTQLPEAFDVELPNAGSRKAHVVWSGGTVAGCIFDIPLSKADISAARLKSARPQSAIDAEAAAKALELQPSDPIWDVTNEATTSEKWPLRARAAAIGVAALASWAPETCTPVAAPAGRRHLKLTRRRAVPPRRRGRR